MSVNHVCHCVYPVCGQLGKVCLIRQYLRRALNEGTEQAIHMAIAKESKWKGPEARGASHKLTRGKMMTF